MQNRGLSEEMQPQAAPSSSCWRNFHHVQNITALGVQWLFGCLPCVKGHHRIHPTILESPDALYIAIDKKKRLRVLHVVPDSDVSSISGKTCVFDQVDFEECCTLDSSGEDYWFMRWSRPIRPNLQRNSCGCSFRRSQIKSSSDLKDLKSNENNNENPVGDEVDRATFPSQTLLEESLAGGLCMLAEKLAQDILKEAVKRSCKIKIKNVSKIKQGNNLNHCDTDCVKNVERNVEKSKVEFSGYINPVFIASSDELNLSSQNSTFEDSCDTSNFSAVIINEDSSMKEFQDCNANDQNQYAVAEKNARNKYDLMSSKEELGYKKRHRKSCLSGSKTYLQKPLLLLIHGAGSNCEVWHNLISHLVRGGYECVAPDLLGHGLSSAPDKASCYTFHSFLQDLLCIFDRFVVEGRTAVILGHGYGCSLAAAIARYRPEQVIQLVLISGGGPTPLAPRNPPSVSLCLRACLEPLLMCGFKRDVVYSVCGKQMEPLSPEISGVPRHIVDHISQGHVWPEGDAAFHRRIVSPTLLVHGMKDPHITLVQQCEMERTIPRSFLEVIPEAGHWSMLETPSHLSHMILCFIDWWAPTQ